MDTTATALCGLRASPDLRDEGERGFGAWPAGLTGDGLVGHGFLLQACWGWDWMIAWAKRVE